MIFRKILVLFLIFIIYSSTVKSQNKTTSDSPDDSTKTTIRKSDSKTPRGIFAVPSLGVSLPLNKFSLNSNSTICLGMKLEYASLSIYPIIPGISYEHVSHLGNDNYKTQNFLNSIQTNISAYGAGFDIILNKYLKSNYTIPFVIAEIKYITVQRIIDPAINNTNLATSANFIGFMGGIGLTLYIFDIYGTYTFAKEYTTFAMKMRFHFPVIKF